MNKGAKLALWIGIPATLFSIYWFGVRNRQPKLIFERIDYGNKNGVVRFGSTENSFSINKGFSANAGKTYSDRYTMTSESDGPDKIVFKVFKHAGGMSEEIEKVTLDFKAQLKY